MLTIIVILTICIPIAYLWGYTSGRKDEKEIALQYLEMQGRTDPIVVEYKKKKRPRGKIYREKPKSVHHKHRSWPKKQGKKIKNA